MLRPVRRVWGRGGRVFGRVVVVVRGVSLGSRVRGPRRWLRLLLLVLGLPRLRVVLVLRGALLCPGVLRAAGFFRLLRVLSAVGVVVFRSARVRSRAPVPSGAFRWLVVVPLPGPLVWWSVVVVFRSGLVRPGPLFVPRLFPRCRSGPVVPVLWLGCGVRSSWTAPWSLVGGVGRRGRLPRGRPSGLCLLFLRRLDLALVRRVRSFGIGPWALVGFLLRGALLCGRWGAGLVRARAVVLVAGVGVGGPALALVLRPPFRVLRVPGFRVRLRGSACGRRGLLVVLVVALVVVRGRGGRVLRLPLRLLPPLPLVVVVVVVFLLLALRLIPRRPLLGGAPPVLRARVCVEVVAAEAVAMVIHPLPLLRPRRMVFQLMGVITLSCRGVALAHRSRHGQHWTRLTWNPRFCERRGQLRNVHISFEAVCCMHLKWL